MKHFLVVALLLLPVMGVFAQGADKPKVKSHKLSFVGRGSMPDITKYLPGPPKDSDVLYKNDLYMYNWGKSQRNTLRGDTAVADASFDVAYYMKRFGEAIGKNINSDNCPKLAKLIGAVSGDMRYGIENAKNYYARHRPYQVFNEHTPIPENERDTEYTSYPSGHTICAWGVALLFVTLDPAHENAIMKVGYDMGESRVIVGYHFQSDVDAARLAASASFARLCAEPTFWAYIQLAKSELMKLE